MLRLFNIGKSLSAAIKGFFAILLSLLLCCYLLPLGAFAQGSQGEDSAQGVSLMAEKGSNTNKGSGSSATDKDGFVQIDGIYAFDAVLYPYGDMVTCGGYEYEVGPWTRDTPTVTEKGKQLKFEALGTFVSGDLNDSSGSAVIEDGKSLDSSSVVWSVDDPSLATIDFQSGVLTPVSNGTVQVTLTLKSEKSYSGESLKVTFPVVIDINQSKYITGLRILAPDGATPISERDMSYFDLYQYLVDTTGQEDFQTMATTMAPQFYAKVAVFDPVTNQESEYVARSGTELAAACGISDLAWGQATDSNKYGIDATTGMLRMLYPTTNSETIRVYTRSTQSGGLLEDRASLRFAYPGSDDNENEEGYVPSDTLTVMAYYEQYPADVNNTEDQYWLRLNNHGGATSVTYSQSDLQSISSRDQAYTMIGGDDRCCQAIATGVNLMLLLQDALGPNVTVNDIAGFYFKTFDEGYMPGQYCVSASALFSDRYFYPYYFENGSMVGAEQVYPILAWSSKLYWSNKYPDINVTSPSAWNRDDMSDSTRYRLIFGAQPDSGFSTKNSVYCINTMYVVLKGGPEISGGDGDDDNPAKPDNPGEGGNGDQGGDSSGDSKGDPSDKPQGETGGSDEQSKDATKKDAEQKTDSDVADKGEDGREDKAETSSDQQSSTEEARRQTIYQMMNKNELEVTLTVENTLGWLLIPLASIAFAGGIGYALVYYRRQTKPVSSSESCESSKEE